MSVSTFSNGSGGRALSSQGTWEGTPQLSSLTALLPARVPRGIHTHAAFTDGAGIPFPCGTVRARAAVCIHALGAEPRLEFLYLRQSRSAGHRDAAGSLGTAHLLPHLKRCLTTNGDRGECLKHFPGTSDLLVRQLVAVCPKAP